MSLTLFESIQQIVREEVGQVRTAEFGVVQDQHPHASGSDNDNYECTVALRDSKLVLSHVPVATGQIGHASIPAVGELVLVQFVGGDVNAPVIVGRLYNDADRPPPNTDGKSVLHLPLGAGDDDAVHVELESGSARSLVVKLGSGLAITLADDAAAVKVDIGGGAATLEVKKDGSVSIKGGKVELKGDEVTVEASGSLKLKGATVDIN